MDSGRGCGRWRNETEGLIEGDERLDLSRCCGRKVKLQGWVVVCRPVKPLGRARRF